MLASAKRIGSLDRDFAALRERILAARDLTRKLLGLLTGLGQRQAWFEVHSSQDAAETVITYKAAGATCSHCQTEPAGVIIPIDAGTALRDWGVLYEG